MGVVQLLTNPTATSRRRAKADAAIRTAITVRGHQLVELRPPSIDHIAATIDENRHDDVTRLIVAGGDGLLHHALPAVATADHPIGVVGIGTGNDFARALGLPTSIDDAVAAALADDPPPSPIDLIAGTTTEPDRPRRWAASVVTGGFSGAVNARANSLRFPPGQQRYTVATLLELASLDTVELRLELDGDPHQLDATLFAIANTRYFGGGMAVCPDADPSDGTLDITVVGPTSRFELARVLPLVFSGRHVRHRAVSTFRAGTVTVTTSTALWADGEPFVESTGGPTTTTLAAIPGALRVAGTLNTS